MKYELPPGSWGNTSTFKNKNAYLKYFDRLKYQEFIYSFTINTSKKFVINRPITTLSIVVSNTLYLISFSMLSLIFLSLLGSVLSVPVELQNEKNVADLEYYRLSGQIIPHFYDVRLFFDPNSASGFNGDVSIRFIANATTRNIVLHAMAMQIQSVQLFPDAATAAAIPTSYSLTTNDTHFLEIQSSVDLNAGSLYVLNISYVGTYATNMFGVYISTYQYMGQTQ